MKQIIKFYSEGCGPCKLVGQRIDEVSKEVEFELLNIDIADEDNESLIDEWRLRTVPTVIIIDENQKVLGEFKGMVTKEQLLETLQK